MGEVKNSM